jgi:hypothetical protein
MYLANELPFRALAGMGISLVGEARMFQEPRLIQG